MTVSVFVSMAVGVSIAVAVGTVADYFFTGYVSRATMIVNNPNRNHHKLYEVGFGCLQALVVRGSSNRFLLHSFFLFLGLSRSNFSSIFSVRVLLSWPSCSFIFSVVLIFFSFCWKRDKMGYTRIKLVFLLLCKEHSFTAGCVAHICYFVPSYVPTSYIVVVISVEYSHNRTLTFKLKVRSWYVSGSSPITVFLSSSVLTYFFVATLK